MAINLKLLQITGKKLGEAKGDLNVDLAQAMKDEACLPLYRLALLVLNA